MIQSKGFKKQDFTILDYVRHLALYGIEFTLLDNLDNNTIASLNNMGCNVQAMFKWEDGSITYKVTWDRLKILNT